MIWLPGEERPWYAVVAHGKRVSRWTVDRWRAENVLWELDAEGHPRLAVQWSTWTPALAEWLASDAADAWRAIDARLAA